MILYGDTRMFSYCISTGKGAAIIIWISSTVRGVSNEFNLMLIIIFTENVIIVSFLLL